MSQQLRAVVTDYDFPTLDPERAVLDAAGIELIATQSRSEAELVDNCRSADALLVEYASITRAVVEALERCLVMVRYGVGYDNLDVAAATEQGIWACNVPDYCIDEVSDHALALLLALARKVVALNNAAHGGRLDVQLAKPIFRLQEQTVGVVGFGRIGSTFGRKVAGLGCRVLAHDPVLSDDEIAARGAGPTDFETLMRESDFVSLHLPLTAETRHLINPGTLNLMKPTAFLINTSRGPLVDSLGVAEAIRAASLAGAALDVVEEEPLPANHPLVGLANCLLTPHAAFYSEQSFIELKTRAAEEAVRVLQGGEPNNPVNPDVRQQAAERARSLGRQHGSP